MVVALRLALTPMREISYVKTVDTIEKPTMIIVAKKSSTEKSFLVPKSIRCSPLANIGYTLIFISIVEAQIEIDRQEAIKSGNTNDRTLLSIIAYN